MKKIFLPYDISNLSVGSKVSVTGDDYNHIAHSLRASIGDKFIIGDDFGSEWSCQIESINKNEVLLSVIESYQRQKSNQKQLILVFSLLKGDKNEEIIKRGTEIGVTRFVPVVTNNSIVKIDKKNGKNKLERWQVIAKEASMQSGRHKIPVIDEVFDFAQIKSLETCNNRYFGQILSEIDGKSTLLSHSSEDIAIFVGPEGDFTSKEEEVLTNLGWQGLRFETNVLRSETAAIYFASIINFLHQ